MDSITRASAMLANIPPRLAAIAALTMPVAHAQDVWDGGGADDHLSTDLNWTDDTAPTGGDITFGGVTRTSPVNDLLGATFGPIRFTNDGTAGTHDAPFVLSGNSVILGGNLITTASSVALEDEVQTDLELNANRNAIAVGSHTLKISGDVSGAFTLTIGNNNNVNDEGLVTLSGNNTHSQTTVGRNGQLRVESDTAVGDRLFIGRNTDTFLADGLTLNPVNGIAFQNSANSHIIHLSDEGATSAEIQSDVDVQISGTANSRTASINVGEDDVLTLSGRLTSSNSNNAKRLLKGGAGTLVLTNGTNDYEGIVRVDSGTVELRDPLALQAATIGPNGGGIVFDDVSTGGSATFGGLNDDGGLVLETSTGGPLALTIGNDVIDRTYAGDLSDNGSGGGSLIKAGAYTQVLTGTNTYGGSTTVTDGVLQLGNAGTTGSLAATSGVTVTAPGVLSVNRTNEFTQDDDLNGAVISGTGSFTQAGSGTTTLSAANTYTGATTVSAGTLEVTGSLTSDITVADGATLSGGGSTTGHLTLGDGTGAGAILDASAGGFTSEGLATVVTGGNVSVIAGGYGVIDLFTYGAGGGVFNGSLTDFTVVSGLGGHGTPGVLYDDGTAITLDTGADGNNVWLGTTDDTWEIGGINSNWQSTFADGVFFDADAVVFDDTGLAQPNVTVVSSVAPDSITFAHTSGLYIISDNGGGETINLGTGVFNTASGDTTINATLSGTGGISHTGSGQLTLGGNNSLSGPIVNEGSLILNQSGEATYSGGISGSGTLTLSGSGTTNLTGAGSFSGGTTLADGRLNVGISDALGTGPVTLVGGLLYESGAEVTLDNEIIASGETAIQASAGGNLNLNGAITGSGILNFGGVAPASSVIINTDLSGFTGTITHQNVNNDNNLFFSSTVNTSASLFTSGTTGGSRQVRFANGGTIGELSGTGGRVRADGPLVVNQSTSTTFAGSLQDLGGGMSLVKQGVGSLTLSGPNSYTGDTTVTAGTLTLADGGVLTFAPGANGTGTRINGTGTLNLDGEMFLNLGGADATGGNSWLLVDVGSLSASYGETFSVNSSLGAFTETAGVWTLSAGAEIWTFTEATGTLTVESGDYGSWMNGFSSLSDGDPALDFDGGSLATGIEFVVGGDPTNSADDAALAPTGTVDESGNLIFTFRRTDLANDDPNATIKVEYGSDLLGWTVADDADEGVSIEVTDDGFGTAIDRVDVTLDPGLAGDGRIFVRLSVAIAAP